MFWLFQLYYLFRHKALYFWCLKQKTGQVISVKLSDVVWLFCTCFLKIKTWIDIINNSDFICYFLNKNKNVWFSLKYCLFCHKINCLNRIIRKYFIFFFQNWTLATIIWSQSFKIDISPIVNTPWNIPKWTFKCSS